MVQCAGEREYGIAAVDSFHYRQSIVLLCESLITPVEISMTEVIFKVPTDIADAIYLPPDVIHAGLLKGAGTCSL
jgi:hypothetical protein